MVTRAILIEDSQLGFIVVSPRRNARNISATVRDGELHLTVPYGCPRQRIDEAMEAMRPGLEKMLDRNKPEFAVGQCLHIDGTDIVIELCHDPRMRHGSAGRIAGRDKYIVYVNCDDPSDLSPINRCIIQSLVAIGKHAFSRVVLPEAKAEAARLGLSAVFKPGHGHRRLGVCTSDGIIRLSTNMVYYPAELRRLVICHELAHLTHMDHSKAFHALLDIYVGGREAELNRALHAFRPPTS